MFIHKAYGWRLTAIELRNTLGQKGYGLEQNIYNILDGTNDTDNHTVTAVMQAPAAATTMGRTVNTANTTIVIPPKITAAIYQLLANQTANMLQMAATPFTPAPTQATRQFVACKPFQVPPIQQPAIPMQQ
jgi:hypothetical protein